MNGNIDVRVSNYLSILSNPSLQGLFTADQIMAMKDVVSFYAKATVFKTLADYQQAQQTTANQEFEQPEVPKVF